ncbi:TPA: nucleoside triphosphate pyrophosphohydrolase [Candidatus Poribacteria bacterium]|nr:nucleoside triphosphate pyrophosphohydrolase [Candidatus Poribacteria bacterium]
MTKCQDLFDKLVEVIAALRGENGCPWDKEQTHSTLTSSLLEETYEVIEAIDADDSAKLREELGDLLMQVVLHAQIAQDENKFNIGDVIQTVTEKLIRRHPHVFGDVQVENVAHVLSNWEAIKGSEESFQDRKSLMDGIPIQFPSLVRARKIQSKASRVGFDWKRGEDVLPKIQEEFEELQNSMDSSEQADIEMEIGDLLFSIVNLSRFLNVDPENALRKVNEKFIRRFKMMESEIKSQGKRFEDYDLEGLDEFWEKAKRNTM